MFDGNLLHRLTLQRDDVDSVIQGIEDSYAGTIPRNAPIVLVDCRVGFEPGDFRAATLERVKGREDERLSILALFGNHAQISRSNGTAWPAVSVRHHPQVLSPSV